MASVLQALVVLGLEQLGDRALGAGPLAARAAAAARRLVILMTRPSMAAWTRRSRKDWGRPTTRPPWPDG